MDFLGKGRVFSFESLFRVSALLYITSLDSRSSLSFQLADFYPCSSFRVWLPTSVQIQQLNRNSLVSLLDDIITIDKVRVNIMANPHSSLCQILQYKRFCYSHSLWKPCNNSRSHSCL